MDDDIFDESDFYAPDEAASEEVSSEVSVDDGLDSEPDVTDDAPVSGEPAVDDGQGEVTDEAPAEGAETQRDYLDLTQFSDKYVRVKVNGEEVDIPVADLPNQAMMHADYTRKTQELAEQRRQVEFWQQVDQAMKVDPQTTLEYLAKTHGVQVAQAAQQRADDDDDWGLDDEGAPPELERFRQELAPVIDFVEQQRAAAYLDQVVQGLSQKYGDDFNPQEVVREATSRGIYDPSMLEMVFKDMSFERYRAQSAAQQQFSAQQQAVTQQRQAAAQTASRVIGNVPSASAAGVATAPKPVVNSVYDAFLVAKKELGLD